MRSPVRFRLLRLSKARPVPAWAVRLRNSRISHSSNPSNDHIHTAYRPVNRT